ncbi:MAG: VWA domain-containing protein [Actinomycetota bacterium]
MGKLAEAAMAPERVDQRNLVALLLDTSESMGRGQAPTPIDELNDAVGKFLSEDIPKHRKLRQSGEIAIGQFRKLGNDQARFVEWLKLADHDAEASHPFYLARDLRAQDQLDASGQTPIATAILLGLAAIEKRKEQLRNSQPPKSHEHRPVLYLVTDGAPEGETDRRMEEAVEELQRAEREKRVLFFSIGTGGADMDLLSSLSLGGSDNAYDLKDQSLSQLLQFVSRSSEATFAPEAVGSDESLVEPGDPMDARNVYVNVRRKFNEGFFKNLDDRPFAG